MIRSMTGYGRGYSAVDGREITVELKSVNHRYLDVSMRLPRTISFLEDTLRSSLSAFLSRGHVDVYVNYRNTRVDARVICVDDALISQYVTAAASLSERYSVENDLAVSTLMRLPNAVDILEAEENRDAVCALAGSAAELAIKELIAMRSREGEKLRADLCARSAAVSSLVDKIRERAPSVVKNYHDKLNERIASLLLEAEIDRARLATEVALFADKACVDEEITRLYSHIAQMNDTLNSEGEAGRRLDFIVQEMNREFNTIGSKANDANLVDLVLLGKAEIEKIREQVQNIE